MLKVDDSLHFFTYINVDEIYFKIRRDDLERRSEVVAEEQDNKE